MKDFYDLYVITSSDKLDYLSLKTAIEQTFNRRGTAIPGKMPEVLSEQVYENVTKKQQWKVFVGKLRNEHTDLQFSTVIKRIQNFTRVFWINNTNTPNTWKPENRWT